MKKTKVVKQNVDVIQTVSILCNLCGEDCCVGNSDDTCDKKSKNLDSKVYGGLLEQEVFGQYYSNALEDAVSYRFSLCESCLMRLFKRFVVPVEKKDRSFFSDYLPEDRFDKKMNQIFKSLSKSKKR
jgi:hypothetical protein